jgi:hypothetical protein
MPGTKVIQLLRVRMEPMDILNYRSKDISIDSLRDGRF